MIFEDKNHLLDDGDLNLSIRNRYSKGDYLQKGNNNNNNQRMVLA